MHGVLQLLQIHNQKGLVQSYRVHTLFSNPIPHGTPITRVSRTVSKGFKLPRNSLQCVCAWRDVAKQPDQPIPTSITLKMVET